MPASLPEPSVVTRRRSLACGSTSTRLWVRYLPAVHGEVDEDVAAETWVTVVRGLARFRGDEVAWRGWGFTTARRRAVDEGRRRTRRRTGPAAERASSGKPSASDPASVVLDRLDTQAVLALVSQLPPLQSEVIVLRMIAGLDVQSVARLVGRSPERSGWPGTEFCDDWRRSLPPRV